MNSQPVHIANVIARLSFHFQNKSREEVRELARLSHEQDALLARKRHLNDLQDMVDQMSADGVQLASAVMR